MTTVSIVTGGSRGLGSNTALSIARQGGDVILTYRSEVAAAEAIVREIEAAVSASMLRFITYCSVYTS